MKTNEEKSRVCVYYEGRVQGVGFRFSVCSIVRDYNLNGYVENLPDGRVAVIVEGMTSQILDFLEKVENCHLKNYIFNSKREWNEFSNQFKSFSVRY
ncbi:acylphosphatase [bacterium]|nr:acylphosphatase [bacterium]